MIRSKAIDKGSEIQPCCPSNPFDPPRRTLLEGSACYPIEMLSSTAEDRDPRTVKSWFGGRRASSVHRSTRSRRSGGAVPPCFLPYPTRILFLVLTIVYLHPLRYHPHLGGWISSNGPRIVTFAREPAHTRARLLALKSTSNNLSSIFR